MNFNFQTNKIMQARRKEQGFTRIELLVVIIVAVLLAAMIMPGYKKVFEHTKLDIDVNNIRQITAACASFAADWDGIYPSFDPDDPNADENSRFLTSTEAFNVLIPEYVGMEQTFWIQTTNPDKLKPPNEDGVLTRNENCYVYVTGQTNTNFSGSPLVADGEMESPGVYGKYHPWLAEKIAVIGYVGGHVVKERLTSSKPGATVKVRKPKTGEDIYSIRQPREGVNKGDDKLDTDLSNVLLP